MIKTKFFVKYLKNISNLINNLLETNLNRLNFKNLNYLLKNNKIILTFVAVLLLFVSYLLLPTFYKQSDISKELRGQLSNKLGLNIMFSGKIEYNFFPRPHFIINSSTIINEEREISKIKKLKIFVSSENFFSFNNIALQDVIIENANFNLNKNNYNFFIKLLDKNFKDLKLTIKNSNIFFRNLEREVMFINKILKMDYYYDPKNLKNILFSNNDIFNIPISIETFFNKDKTIIFSNINLDPIKLKIKNELIYSGDKKLGKSELGFDKLKRKVEYEIEKNYFKFHIFDKKDQPNKTYKGKFNFKPFYAILEGELDEINLNYLFGTNAIIAQLLKTEMFNHKNIDFKLNINSDTVYNKFNFKNINLKTNIQEGLIDADNTKFEWKNFVDFELIQSLIFVKNGELVLDGKLKIKIKDHNEVYKFLLTPKNFRKKIKQIDLNFNYNFDKKTAELKDIKIDNKIDQNLNEILNNIVLNKNDLQNKIYLKNLLNAAIKSYAG